MRYLIAVLISMLVVPPTLSLAHPPLFRLPEGKRVEVSGETLQGYTLEEMKVLLKMDADLESFSEQLPKIKSALDAAEKALKAKDTMLESKDKAISLLTQDRNRITEKWTQENKLRHECENKPKFGSWIAWGLTAVLGATTVALGITLVVKETR